MDESSPRSGIKYESGRDSRGLLAESGISAERTAVSTATFNVASFTTAGFAATGFTATDFTATKPRAGASRAAPNCAGAKSHRSGQAFRHVSREAAAS
jgi:hypothetical protein